jgi:FAD/FMN-containing dehydrogenase/Fe-S oxidoreductase
MRRSSRHRCRVRNVNDFYRPRSEGRRPLPYEFDRKALARQLEKVVSGEVRFDAGSRAMYSTDASNYRQVPIGIVIPKNIEDIIETVEVARRFGAPILSRGGGTSLAGQCCNVAVVLDMSKYMRAILELDPGKKIARVQPGIVLDDLRNAAETHHLTFAPDPATHNHCTLGGMIGNNSCGVHSLMGGRTSENIEELDILTYDGTRMRVGPTSEFELERLIRSGGRAGQIYSGLKAIRDRYASRIRSRFPRIPRRVSGYGLDQLLPENGFHVARSLVGTEGTCVVVLEAMVKLVESPQFRSLVVLGFDDVYTACDHLPAILDHKPIALEGIDDRLVSDMKKKGLHPANLKLLPEGNGWLVVEFGGESKEESDDRARALMDELRKLQTPPSMDLFDDPAKEKLVWTIRESGLGATARVPGEKETWEGWEDSAVHPKRLGRYLRDLRKLLDRYEYACALYGHFGQGCVHTRIDFDLQTKEGIQKFRSFIEDAADLVVRHGGSFSGEHGDGQSRGELLEKMYGNDLVQAFREFKATWDPDWKMNPGKVVDPYRLDENLRLGANFSHPDVKTDFGYSDDHGSFSFATMRCVGVGECRKETHGTMCPSYMVTHEEMHSTRGRAHLLFEMLQGNPLSKGWRDEHVKEALDLCFACKACKSECPVNVDMATYKAEFLSHYYEHRMRPMAAYTMGRIDQWARLAEFAPGIINFFTRTEPFSSLAKRIAGIAPQRQVPQFAKETFRRRSRRLNRKPATTPDRGRVILWPDTFNDHFRPEICTAAFDVLRTAGFQVELPHGRLCCGRPLYDFGFLGRAKRQLRQILDTLRADIRDGTPLIALEPSCGAVFRDELLGLFPRDADALRLSRQTFLLTEFLEKRAPNFSAGPLRRKALVHGHCHQRAIVTMQHDESMLRKIGVDFEVLDSGCCGMAGAFGFEAKHYDVSIMAGERVLLPRVREASPETLIVADGFSCREQIAQTTGRRALHVAEVIRMGLNHEIQTDQ